ncbi:MAG: hypothetical protein DMD43_10595 [Gemmatimonadetes bacterium]|nr:MAG: hypothetical protein DMD43_10595 [Gemmatimonadota bacterium]
MPLVMALLCLVILTIAAAAIMMTLHSETNVAGHNLRGNQALDIAEAGVAEAMARIRLGDIPDNGNPHMVSQIFLAQGGQVPVLGPDSIALATAQPAGQWLKYSMPTPGENVLTVNYKTDGSQSVIYRYDDAKGIQTETGMPIFVITSTGRQGGDRCRVITEAIHKPFNANVMAAVAADKAIKFAGNAEVCGYNHRADTPPGARGRPPESPAGPLGPCLDWETGSGHLPGAWSTSTIDTNGSSAQHGNPTTVSSNQTGFYNGPWEAAGMGQQEFFTWIGQPLRTIPENPRGILYIDDNDIAQDQSGTFGLKNGDGEGLLYIDGDMTLNGNFTYEGLIYVEGNLDINGTCWILGALIVKGKTTIKLANGDCTVLYSSAAIEENISKYGGQIVTLSWREDH